MPIIQKILHPTDFSENARSAFHAACAMAREHHANSGRSSRDDAFRLPASVLPASGSAPSRRSTGFKRRLPLARRKGPAKSAWSID